MTTAVAPCGSPTPTLELSDDDLRGHYIAVREALQRARDALFWAGAACEAARDDADAALKDCPSIDPRDIALNTEVRRAFQHLYPNG